MWRKLNKVMEKNGIHNPNFKGFMADNAQANWNIIQIVYGSRYPSEPRVDREQTCFFHRNQSLDTKQRIKPKMRKKHRTFRYEYKNVIYLEEVDVQYATIHYLWYSLGVVDEAGLQELENWLNFLLF